MSLTPTQSQRTTTSMQNTPSITDAGSYFHHIPHLGVEFPLLPDLMKDSVEVAGEFLRNPTRMDVVHFFTADIFVTPYGICSSAKLKELCAAYANYKFTKESEVSPKVKKATPKKAAVKPVAKKKAGAVKKK